MRSLSFSGLSTPLYGVSSIVLPAYFVSSGLMSKLSTWLTPPHMKSQITDFAFGVKCGLPSGKCDASALAMPSLKSMAPSARPVKPMPVSARNERRVTPRQDRCVFMSAHRDEVVVVHQ